MRICPEIEMVPAAHGKELFAREVRRLCSEQKFDCVAVDIPLIFQGELADAVDSLPLISALIAYREYGDYGGGDGTWPRYYIPVDPCDPMIEGVRQARQRRIPFYCVGAEKLKVLEPLPPLPDEYAVKTIGFEAYMDVCRAAVKDAERAEAVDFATLAGDVDGIDRADTGGMGKTGAYRMDVVDFTTLTGDVDGIDKADAGGMDETYTCGVDNSVAEGIAKRLQYLRSKYRNILAITHLRHFDAVVSRFDNAEIRDVDNHARENQGEQAYVPDFNTDNAHNYTVCTRFVNPDHLYFALGELPFTAGMAERERQNPYAAPVDLADAVKHLFTDTRDNFFESREQAAHLSPVRIQAALAYLRNLTVLSGRLIPSLFDIVEAAKGVGGNAYAVRVLKNAKYYPYLPIESGESLVNIGIGRISLLEDTCPGAEREVYGAANLFRDTALEWRRIDIKPDPSLEQRKKYRYSWNPRGFCSHLPEDARIENFGSHVRGKARRVVTEHLARTEKFTASVKDGIDIRETLRNWHTGSIYVKELPPARGKIDTAVIIFDDGNDDRYPHRTTWYAERSDESTLTFFATNPFENLIGPGVARCDYGGLAMLFPPRSVPNMFPAASAMGIRGCAAQLAFGSMFFSKERDIAYIAASSPNLYLRTLSRRLKKHLVWIPLSTFSAETLTRLRRFHVLNGKGVRSWASRFIGDEL